MIIRRIVTSLMLCVALGVGFVRAQSQDAATTAALIAKGQALVDLLIKGDFAAAVAEFDDTMKTTVPEARLRDTWTGLPAQVGAFKQKKGARVEPRGAYQAVIVTCDFERTALEVQVVFDASGRVSGLSVRPATAAPYTPPSYAKIDALMETEVTVGSGEWALPGTLAMPIGAGPFPAVVLVHGSGPNDRDETIGVNKPFRDLALGLASRGIAVLRYEKRTKVYPEKMMALVGLTVKEETIDDALIAAEMLRLTPGIDPARVFVIGHSLGGMLIPRIAARDPKMAGFIVMAGAVKSLPDVLVDQTRYLAMADGVVSPDEQKQIDMMVQLVATVNALTPADVAKGGNIAGAPPSYWVDLRGYDPPADATSITRPLLILQGERDYQVTMDDFAKWKAALSSKANVTFHSYPGLNHAFLAGSGKSLPAEYGIAGHVAEDVVRDIVAWILAAKH